MHRPIIHGARGGDQSLAQNLAAKHALPALLWTSAAKKIDLNGFEIQKGQEFLYRFAHPDFQFINAGTVYIMDFPIEGVLIEDRST